MDTSAYAEGHATGAEDARLALAAGCVLTRPATAIPGDGDDDDRRHFLLGYAEGMLAEIEAE